MIHILRPSLSAACLLVLGIASGRADDLPVLQVPRVDGPIAMDGQLKEKCWNDAARIVLSDPWKQGGHSLEPTEVLLLSTDKAIYIAFLAQDRDILATRTARDDQTHRDDCVEIFLGRPWESLGECLGMEINALGTVADFYYRHLGWVNYGWEPEAVRIQARREDSFALGRAARGPGYAVEVEIPWTELLYALPERRIPTRLRANFARWNYGKEGRIFSIWSDPRLPTPGPYRLDRFGWLSFTQDDGHQ